MIRGLQIAASGVLTQQKRMDAISDNMANIGTAGYKKGDLLTRSFGDMLLRCVNAPADTGGSVVGLLNNGIQVDRNMTRFSQGQLTETGIPTDLAIDGNGFFAVMTPDGVRYTRSGNFTADSEGFLCTVDGYKVMGRSADGTLTEQIHMGSEPFSVSSDGRITADKTDLFLNIVRFSDNRQLTKQGNNLFYAAGQPLPNYLAFQPGSEQADSAVCKIMQGFLEDSNTDISQEMTGMIEVSRNYAANLRVLNMVDGTLNRAVNEIARMEG